MYVKCGRAYDDAVQWTICPHGPLGAAHDDYCPKCDIVGAWQGPCEHLVAGRRLKDNYPAKEYAAGVLGPMLYGAVVFCILYKFVSWLVGPPF